MAKKKDKHGFEQHFHGPVGQINQAVEKVSSRATATSNKWESYVEKLTSNIRDQGWRHPLVVGVVSAVTGSVVTALLSFSISAIGKDKMPNQNLDTSSPSVNASVKDLGFDDLRNVQTYEIGKHVNDLPDDIYGFEYDFLIVSELTDKSGKKWISLEAEPSLGKFEVQKISNRSFLIGFVDRQNYQRAFLAKETTPVEVILMPRSWKEATIPVAIPLDAISEAKSKELSYWDENIDMLRTMSSLELKVSQIIASPVSHHIDEEG